MNAVAKVATTPAVQVTSKKALKIVVDTGTNQARIAELGLPVEFQNETKLRKLEINLDTHLPTLAGAKVSNIRNIEITGALQAIGLISSVDSTFHMLAVCTEHTITFLVQIEKKVFTFVYDGFVSSGRAAFERLFTECLVRGPRGYENNAKLIPDFWHKLLTMLYPEGGKLEFCLYNRDKEAIPAAVIFNPATTDQTLTINGYAYNLDMNVFPRESINRGFGAWKKEQEKRGRTAGAGRVTLNDLLVPRSNKDKVRETRKTPSELGIKPLGEMLKVHERTPAEIEGDNRRAAEVAAKKARNAKPAKAAQQPAKEKADKKKK